jgi:hypothetical protein
MVRAARSGGQDLRDPKSRGRETKNNELFNYLCRPLRGLK